ncbi:acetyltransferase (GNAT) family protein [Stackebrandtia albiflava]|uniref:Acetyltransferase (GNAT) family protein n=1 Tax=Stackebrandtia albiflava TaxID=406432 RepID=A0A562V302_9ACTN|nr:GNAT family N-acetyltransferase [Stackebrandtia albiflava]TWJ12223.1 acetyltransferase (GNAT) family protein [Stackebrandtia albiflava]
MIRPATEDDAVAFPDLDWVRPHRRRPDDASYVVDGVDGPVAVARCARNEFHPGRSPLWVYVRPGHRRRGLGTALVRELSAHADRPFSAKVRPDSTGHHFARALGAVEYQRCPPSVVDTTAAGMTRWIAAHLRDDVVTGDAFTADRLLDLWTDYYVLIHAGWSPTAPRARLRELFTAMITDELTPARSRFALRAGGVVAACFVFESGADESEAIAECLTPDAADARALLAGCIAAALAGSPVTRLVFDGHVTDPHFHPLLAGMPGVTGPVTALLEIPPR